MFNASKRYPWKPFNIHYILSYTNSYVNPIQMMLGKYSWNKKS